MRRALAAIAWLGLVLAPVPTWASAAGDYQQVLQVYERDGSVAPCQFTGAQLQAALGGVDTYGAQYFADFTQAVQTALSARAGGACAATAAGPGASAGHEPGSRSPVPAPPSIALTAATSSGVPLPLALLGGAAALGALGLAGRAARRGTRTN
jgi:hypothetical protein